MLDRTYLLSFATSDFSSSQEKLVKSALNFGISKFITLNDKDFKETTFYKNNQGLATAKRGAGFWIWKPYYIVDSLERLQENEILIYSDAGVEIISSLSPLLELTQYNDILLFADGGQHKNKEYTKSDCFKLMNATSPRYLESVQVQASFQIYKKTKKSLAFTREWLKKCLIPGILNDTLSAKNELPNFLDHRHDQSVLSILAIKHNIELFRDPSQWGEFVMSKYPNSQYKTLLNHHRMRNTFIQNLMHQILTMKSKGNAHK